MSPYLFFADDIFLFSRAIDEQASTMKASLDDFCGASRAKVNLEKSKLFIYPRSRHGQAGRLRRLLVFIPLPTLVSI